MIPDFAAWAEQAKLRCDFDNAVHLIEELHRAGINIRYLGHVRCLLQGQQARRLILTEIESRYLL